METKINDCPLFDKNDEDLVGFAWDTQNRNVSDVVDVEMMRRMKIAIVEFNRQSSEQTNKMIKLTHWIIFLTIVLGVLAITQIILLLK